MKKWFFFILSLVAISLPYLPFAAENQQGHKSKHNLDVAATSGAEPTPAYPSMPGPGKKIPIESDYYLTLTLQKQFKKR